MFCPKCGISNPDDGKFCRSCGTDLGTVSDALSGRLAKPGPFTDRKGKPLNYQGAITTFFMGIAFLIVTFFLAVSGMGRGWWFWMLIPSFGMLGSGIAQYVQLKKSEQTSVGFAAPQQRVVSAPPQSSALPPSQTAYVSPETRYKTGDLVPPSVTDATTRHLESDSEGETMTLPKL